MQIGDLSQPVWAETVYKALRKKMNIPEDATNSLFIHVRRTDYLAFPSAEFPAALPAEFFSQALIVLKRRFPGSPVLCFSDDLEV